MGSAGAEGFMSREGAIAGDFEASRLANVMASRSSPKKAGSLIQEIEAQQEKRVSQSSARNCPVSRGPSPSSVDGLLGLDEVQRA